MKPSVAILCTVRKPELLPAALLTFQTLRVGFPTADIFIYGNALDAASQAIVLRFAESVQGRFNNLPATSHDAWIEHLVWHEARPFWILDTDLVFWQPVEQWFNETDPVLVAGRFEPEFDEEATRSRHVARLHTCAMWFNPGPLRSALRAWMCRVPEPWRSSAQFPFIRQTFLARGQEVLFYDTCAGLHAALGGTRFSAAQDEAFDHLHCATYVDTIGPQLTGLDLAATHRAIYADPGRARGMHQQQQAYYRSRQPKENVCPTIPE